VNTQWISWSGLVEGRPARWLHPRSEDEIAQAIGHTAAAGGRIAVSGSGHSFAPLVSTERSTLLSLRGYAGVESIDHEAMQVTVRSGTTLRALNELLLRAGLALPNQTAIDAQTIGGVVATASHGGGTRYGSLSQHVVGARVVTADGSVRQIAETDAEIDALRLNLGCLGVVSTLRLSVVPSFTLRKVIDVRRVSDLAAVMEHVRGQEFGGMYWYPHTGIVRVWHAQQRPASHRTQQPAGRTPPHWLLRRSMAPAPLARHVNRAIAALGGRHSDRTLPSDRAIVGALAPRQQALEYAVPADVATGMARDLIDLVDRRRLRVAAPIEFRFTAADTAWLSPAYGRQACYVNVASYLDAGRDWATPFRQIADLLAAHGGRTHWAKVHWFDRVKLAGQYPRWNDFQRARTAFDRNGLFLNDYLRALFVPDSVRVPDLPASDRCPQAGR